MSLRQKNWVLALIIFVLIVIFAPFCGNLYEVIIGHPIAPGFGGPDNPEYFEGFFMSYAFFITLLVTLFKGKNKYKILMWSLGWLVALDLLLWVIEGLIINLSAALIAFILAQIILLLCKQFKK